MEIATCLSLSREHSFELLLQLEQAILAENTCTKRYLELQLRAAIAKAHPANNRIARRSTGPQLSPILFTLQQKPIANRGAGTRACRVPTHRDA